MTAITVGSTIDYTSDSPDNYSGINQSEPASPLLSASNLWLVDPTQLSGITSDSGIPEFYVPSLIETPASQLVVPFNNVNYNEPEIQLGALTAISTQTFNTDTPIADNNVLVAAVTGRSELSSRVPSSSIQITSSQLSGSSVNSSFSGITTGSSEGSTGSALSRISSGSGTGTNTSGTNTSGTSTSGTSTSGISTSGISTSGTSTSGTSTSSLIAQNSGSQTATEVPFSFSESLGLGLLLFIVGGHKLLKRSANQLKNAH
jgi:hypothetical protein